MDFIQSLTDNIASISTLLVGSAGVALYLKKIVKSEVKDIHEEIKDIKADVTENRIDTKKIAVIQAIKNVEPQEKVFELYDEYKALGGNSYVDSEMDKYKLGYVHHKK
jgi:uncharacterized protein (UPF0335 family)